MDKSVGTVCWDCTTMYLLYMGYIGNIWGTIKDTHIFPLKLVFSFPGADGLGCQALPPIERLFRVSHSGGTASVVEVKSGVWVALVFAIE